MKKRALMALPKLTATDEMKQIAASDLPRKEKIAYGYVQEVCEYYVYLRCITQDGILKVAFFFPEHLRIDGNSPAYEVYLDKEKRQFITYNSLNQKWCEAKLDRLDWKRRYWYIKAYWVSEEDETSIQAYLNINKKAVEAIRQFQRNVREEQLEQRHRRETDPWDKDMEQVPELPKDWNRWVDKVAIRQNYIYYHYKKGGAKTGYCTYCEKEVPIKVHPHHNQQGRCSCCRHPVVFKAYGRAGYSKEELEDEHRAEAERKEQEKRLEQEKRTIQKREKLQQLYNGSAESLVKFIGGYYYRDEKKEVLDMAFDKLVEWPAGCVQTMDAKDAHAFFELCGELVESEPRPRHEILNMVLTMIGGEAA